MQNLFETVKKAQQVVQVEAVRVQKELEEYVKGLSCICLIFGQSHMYIKAWIIIICNVIVALNLFYITKLFIFSSHKENIF